MRWTCSEAAPELERGWVLQCVVGLLGPVYPSVPQFTPVYPGVASVIHLLSYHTQLKVQVC